MPSSRRSGRSVAPRPRRQIALDFYEQVAKGETLSEVLRRAREPFVEKFETKSATWMAYQLFGHPSFVVGGLKAKGGTMAGNTFDERGRAEVDDVVLVAPGLEGEVTVE